MNLYDILACPNCKVAVIRQGETLSCTECKQSYPIINGVPILLPDGGVPNIQHEAELSIRTGYNPWIERIVMQSLPPNSIVLDLGAGNMAFNLPHVIRMDVTLTPYVDVVGDAHALPFLPNTFDFIFSLAVIEHLRQPFVAAEEMYKALRNGGYVYGECNFVYPYHGYPHHYFGTTQQGIEQVFKQFSLLRSGVPTYQMPSFAVRFILQTYDQLLSKSSKPEISMFRELIQNVLNQSLGTYDGEFSEESALRLAAGVFFFGMKSQGEMTDVIPKIVQDVWKQDTKLQQRFPNMHNLGTVDNITLWAKSEGGKKIPKIAEYFNSVTRFRKNESVGDDDLNVFNELPILEPAYGYIADTQRAPMLSQRVHEMEAIIAKKNEHITYLEMLIRQIEAGRVMRLLRMIKR